MKIFLVTNMFPYEDNPYYGIFVAEQVEAMKRRYKDVSYDVFFINGKKGKIEYIKSIYQVNRIIAKGKYDLIHIHFGLSGLFLIWPYHPIPIILTLHGSDIQPEAKLGKTTLRISRFAAKRADRVIILNDNMRAIVKELNSNYMLLPCSINTDIFYPHKIKNTQEEKIIVFPSSRDRRVKNYALFEETIRILRTQYGILCRTVELCGLSRDEVADLFSKADLLLMTSMSEGSPQAIKEAMACNLSCVSTPVGDVRELLDGVVDSYVSNSHDANELASLVFKSLTCKEKGIMGCEKIKMMKLDEVSVSERLYSIYKAMIEKK